MSSVIVIGNGLDGVLGPLAGQCLWPRLHGSRSLVSFFALFRSRFDWDSYEVAGWSLARSFRALHAVALFCFAGSGFVR